MTTRTYRTTDIPEVQEQMWEWFAPGLAFDIGANDGQSVEEMLNRGATRVIALEPAEESYARLRANWSGDDRAVLFNIAAGAQPGALVLSARCWPLAASGQLVARHMPDMPLVRFSEWWDGPGEDRTVPCTTLDILAKQYGLPDFVKVDTEGSEEQVLAGACGLLSSRLAHWLVEFHSPALRRAVQAAFSEGYETRWVRCPHDAAHHEEPELDVSGWILARPLESA